jgi:tyrosinase
MVGNIDPFCAGIEGRMAGRIQGRDSVLALRNFLAVVVNFPTNPLPIPRQAWRFLISRSEPMPDGANPIKTEAGALRVRKNVRKLTDVELNDLRNAFEGLYKISEDGGNDDERGYQWIAAVHGFPPQVYCQHGNLHFPTWHRAYIYEFEQRLQEQVESVMLPYWDWTSDETAQEGIPEALIEETYVDLHTGETKPNPLLGAFSQVNGGNTGRDPGNVEDFQFFQEMMASAQEETTYDDYSRALENPHGGIHVWVGGDMSSVPTASYDPIFWMHHCNVDRYWYEWQQVHGDASVPQFVRDFVCAPFTYTGEQTLDTAFFGYTYADDESFVTPGEAEPAPQAELTPTMVFNLGEVEQGVEKASLAFYGLKKTKESYQVRVFCAADGYDATSERKDNPAYGNTLYLFGHGECGGGPGHCDLRKTRRRYDRRPEHHLTPYNTALDVTKAVQHATKGRRGSAKKVSLSFVVMDAKGQQVAPSAIEFDGVSLITKR